MELGLDGYVALVIGVSRGIGAARCTKLARKGVHVCLVARDRAKLHEVAASITNAGAVHTVVHVADLSQPQITGTAAEAAIAAAFGRFDILLNNAGATKRTNFITWTKADRSDGFALRSRGYVRFDKSSLAISSRRQGVHHQYSWNWLARGISRIHHRPAGRCSAAEFHQGHGQYRHRPSGVGQRDQSRFDRDRLFQPQQCAAAARSRLQPHRPWTFCCLPTASAGLSA